MDGCCSYSHSRKGLLPTVGSGVSWKPLAVSSFKVCISCRTMTSSEVTFLKQPTSNEWARTGHFGLRQALWEITHSRAPLPAPVWLAKALLVLLHNLIYPLPNPSPSPFPPFLSQLLTLKFLLHSEIPSHFQWLFSLFLSNSVLLHRFLVKEDSENPPLLLVV